MSSIIHFILIKSTKFHIFFKIIQYIININDLSIYDNKIKYIINDFRNNLINYIKDDIKNYLNKYDNITLNDIKNNFSLSNYELEIVKKIFGL